MAGGHVSKRGLSGGAKLPLRTAPGITRCLHARVPPCVTDYSVFNTACLPEGGFCHTHLPRNAQGASAHQPQPTMLQRGEDYRREQPRQSADSPEQAECGL